ncbi:MAG: hypothetical protein KC731_34190, partial [Myxococcales bacterium]|nr:hypothetical protein [Myxococcales bacterium]
MTPGGAARVEGWIGWFDRFHPKGPAPTGLSAQFRRNAHLYGVGTVMVAVQQLCMAKRDYLVKDAVDAINGGRGSQAAAMALFILAVSIAAMVTRLLSRATIFTGGRNVEYELRQVLLAHLHRLGPSFFATHPTGEIMSRA